MSDGNCNAGNISTYSVLSPLMFLFPISPAHLYLNSCHIKQCLRHSSANSFTARHSFCDIDITEHSLTETTNFEIHKKWFICM